MNNPILQNSTLVLIQCSKSRLVCTKHALFSECPIPGGVWSVYYGQSFKRKRLNNCRCHIKEYASWCATMQPMFRLVGCVQCPLPDFSLALPLKQRQRQLYQAGGQPMSTPVEYQHLSSEVTKTFIP